MASIQQSLNQLLGAAAGVATAGSYLYRQTPGYQGKQAIKTAENLLTVSKEIVADDLEEGTKVAEEAVAAARKGYSLKRSNKAENTYFDALSNLQDYKEALEMIEPKQKQAEQNAITRIQKQTMTHREMFEGLLARKELLSAKEHGQLDTMYHRHLKKGELD